MGNSYTLNLDYLDDLERNEFLALISKIAERQRRAESRSWKPDVGESYFAIESSEYVDECIVNYCADSEYDKFNISIGNCFRTREDAEFAVEKLKIIAEMKRYIAEHDDVELDWDNPNQLKYYLVFNRRSGAIDFVSIASMQVVEASLCTSVGSVLLGMIKEIGQDRIKKYYFGVS